MFRNGLFDIYFSAETEGRKRAEKAELLFITVYNPI